MSSASPPASFRPDIDGLRAIAILIVVAFHADVPFFGSGFIGVDVFFVISGFLITRRLFVEVEEKGRIDLPRFWLGRALRLLPAAAVMITVSLLASFLILVPFEWPRLVGDAWAASLYWANFRFGAMKGSYFGASAASSPFLHTWSLSVEEQFYVLWPIALTVASAFCVWNRRRATIIAVAAGLTAGSLMISIQDAATPTSMTYFHSFSRVWELGAGALLAMVWPEVHDAVRRARVGAGLRWVGLGLLAVSLMVIEPERAFPGWRAAGPVVAALFLIAAHADRGLANRVLTAAWSQRIGRWSYSWYLWHWPLLVLGGAAVERWLYIPSSWPLSVLLAALALLPAIASYRYVEQPMRHNRWIGTSVPRAGWTVAGLTVMSLLALVGFGIRASSTLAQPDVLALADARSDWPSIPPGCATTDADRLLADCVVGAGGQRVMLVGDSHMANWAPGVTSAVLASDGHVVSALGGSCTLIGHGTETEPGWCTAMREGLDSAIGELAPDLIVISHSSGVIGHLLDARAAVGTTEDRLAGWGNALESLLRDLDREGIEVVVVLATPRHERHPIDCAVLAPPSASCVMTRKEAVASVKPFNEAQRQAVERAGHGTVIAPVDLLCGAQRCRFEDNGEYVWNDEHHITKSYSATLGDEFSVLLPLERTNDP